jgi:hypothetical protein
MPATLERALKSAARKKHLGKERTGAYVYGTMRKMGWKPDNKSRVRALITTKKDK